MALDLYDVLGVKHDASPDDIRKAYKIRCLECHPDKNNNKPQAAAAFSELSCAYATLSNPTLRQEYNRQREYVPSGPNDPFADFSFRKQFAEELSKSCAAQGDPVDPEALFESLFGRARARPDDTRPFRAPSASSTPATANAPRSSARESRSARPPRDAQAPTVKRPTTPSPSVPGAGVSGGVRVRPASRPPSRAGRSHAERDPARFSGPRKADVLSDDMDCDVWGAGEPRRLSSGSLPLSPEDIREWRPQLDDHEVDLPLTLEELYCGCVKRCPLRKQVLDPASGEYVQREEVFSVVVQPGYRAGDKVRFCKAHDEFPGGTPADVVFVIRQLPHARFTVNGAELRTPVALQLVDALVGADVRIPTLGGGSVHVRTNEVIRPGAVKRVVGKGMPLQAGESGYGDLLVTFEVLFPKALAVEDRRRVREVFRLIDGNGGSGYSGSSVSGGQSWSRAGGLHASSIGRTSSMFSRTSPMAELVRFGMGASQAESQGGEVRNGAQRSSNSNSSGTTDGLNSNSDSEITVSPANSPLSAGAQPLRKFGMSVSMSGVVREDAPVGTRPVQRKRRGFVFFGR